MKTEDLLAIDSNFPGVPTNEFMTFGGFMVMIAGDDANYSQPKTIEDLKKVFYVDGDTSKKPLIQSSSLVVPAWFESEDVGDSIDYYIHFYMPTNYTRTKMTCFAICYYDPRSDSNSEIPVIRYLTISNRFPVEFYNEIPDSNQGKATTGWNNIKITLAKGNYEFIQISDFNKLYNVTKIPTLIDEEITSNRVLLNNIYNSTIGVNGVSKAEYMYHLSKDIQDTRKVGRYCGILDYSPTFKNKNRTIQVVTVEYVADENGNYSMKVLNKVGGVATLVREKNCWVAVAKPFKDWDNPENNWEFAAWYNGGSIVKDTFQGSTVYHRSEYFPLEENTDYQLTAVFVRAGELPSVQTKITVTPDTLTVPNSINNYNVMANQAIVISTYPPGRKFTFTNLAEYPNVHFKEVSTQYWWDSTNNYDAEGKLVQHTPGKYELQVDKRSANADDAQFVIQLDTVD